MVRTGVNMEIDLALRAQLRQRRGWLRQSWTRLPKPKVCVDHEAMADLVEHHVLNLCLGWALTSFTGVQSSAPSKPWMARTTLDATLPKSNVCVSHEAMADLA